MNALKRWGFLELGVGLLLAAAVLRLSPWSWLERLQIALVVAGVVALGVALFVNAAAVRTWLGGRSARYGFAAVVMIVLALGVAVLANAIALRHSPRWDLTENKRHSLSPQTVKVLQGLPAPVKAIAFVRTDTSGVRRTTEDMLKQFAGASGGKFTYRLEDPDREPGLAKGYGIEQYGQIVLIRETPAPAPPAPGPVPGKDAGPSERGQGGLRQEKVNDVDEEKLTNTLVKLMRDSRRTIYVSKGHGEPEIGSAEKSGLSQAKDRLERANYMVKELVLAREGKIPDDASVLIMPGPRTDPFPPELAAIDAFVARGGKVLFMVNPFATDALAKHLTKWGVVLGDDVVLETNLVSQITGLGPLVPFVSQYEGHPVTRDLKLATLFPLVRSIEAAKTPPTGTTVQILARTSPQSWGETDRGVFQKGTASPDPNEKRGPLGVAAAVETPRAAPEPKPDDAKAEPKADEGKKPGKARLAVVGTSMLATNQFIGIEGNPDFFLNLVSWLAEDEDLISIRAKDVKQVPIILTGAQGNAVLWIPVLVLPGLVMLGGVVAAVRRRRSK